MSEDKMNETWLKDKNGNRCSVEYFGSKEAAQRALDSLRACENCTNCSGCYGCSDCSGCSDCYRCSGCYGCSGCSDCYRCYRCYRCSGLEDVKDEKEEPLEVPRIDNIHEVIYAAASQPKALEMSSWHTCEKTHCRAGWCVALAGEKGRELEIRFDTCVAAMMIYEASGYKISPVRFHDSNEDALADMKRLAQVGA